MPDDDALDQIWSRREVARRLNVSVTTLWRLVRRGHFPPAVRISPGRVGWPARIVRRWIDALLKAGPGRVD